jgi:hypothetical protein
LTAASPPRTHRTALRHTQRCECTPPTESGVKSNLRYGARRAGARPLATSGYAVRTVTTSQRPATGALISRSCPGRRRCCCVEAAPSTSLPGTRGHRLDRCPITGCVSGRPERNVRPARAQGNDVGQRRRRAERNAADAARRLVLVL